MPMTPRFARAAALSVSLAAACGEVDMAQPDAAAHPDASPADAAADAPAGLPPWGEARLIPELADGDVRGGSLTEDRLELYFTSSARGGQGGFEIWRSIRTAATDPWGTPALVVELNTAATDADPSVSPDGLSLWLTREHDGDHDVFVSVRASRRDPWGTPAVVPNLNSPSNDYNPSIAAGGTLIALTSSRNGTSDVFLSHRSDPQHDWSTPALVAEVNRADAEDSAILSGDGLELILTRVGSAGDRDPLSATRPDLDSAFSAPTPIEELRTADNDETSWLSADRRYLFLTRFSQSARRYQAYDATR